jgi:hypothetical protein
MLLCVCVYVCVCVCVCVWVSLFIVNTASMHMGALIFLWGDDFILFEYEAYFLIRNLHTVFHKWLHHPTFLPIVYKGFFFSNHHHLLSSEFFIMGIVLDVRWYLTVILICISLLIYDAGHHFIHILAPWHHFWRNVYPGPLPTFSLGYL